MRGIAKQDAKHARGDSNDDELECEESEDLALGETQATHHCARIEVPQREAARRGRDRDGRDHRGEQRHQREEALCPLDGPLHLRPPTLERFEPLTTRQVAFERSRERAYRGALAGSQQPIGHAASCCDELRGRQVVETDHHARREVDEACTTVGFDGDDAIDAEDLLAQLQPVAGANSDCLQELRIDPGRTRRRSRARHLFGRARLRAHAHRTAQRIARGHGLYGGERIPIQVACVQRHAGKRDCLCHLQTSRARPCPQRLRDRRVGYEDQIRRQELGGVALESETNAIDQEADACHRRHGDYQRRSQQPQFAGAPVARGHAQGLLQ